MATGIVDYNSDLIRRKWVTSKLGQDSAKSFWNAYTGTSCGSVIYQVNNT